MSDEAGSAAPALCRLQLAIELRALRKAADLSAAAVANQLVVSPSKINRLEYAENGVVEPADVMALCTIYGADDELRDTLIGYATVTKTKKDWWQKRDLAPAIPPGFKAYLGAEAVGRQAKTYENEYVPGLLQEEGYCHAILSTQPGRQDEEEIGKRIAVRMTRQEALHRTERPLQLDAIMNEAVLRRRVGGRQVMRKQLEHIVDLASLGTVRIQVVPFELGAHPGMNGSFTILRFGEDVPFQPVVYLENLADNWLLRKQAETARYEQAFTDLQTAAPGHNESVKMIEEAIKEH